MEEERVRVRVVFEDDRHVLRKSQRSEGLKHSWVLLRAHHTSISDLASHLIHTFSLGRSCPHGLLLSMDGFVIPSFESTSIFNDKDIISVRKKGGTAMEIKTSGEDRDHIIDSEILVKQPKKSKKLLELKEFQAELGGYKSEDQHNGCILHDTAVFLEGPSTENTKSKRKRKHSDILQGSKNDHVEEVCRRSTCDSLVASGGDAKPKSRSARRKKVKRQWLREMKKKHIKNQDPANNIPDASPKHQKMDEGNETEGEIVPIVVRPGYIRFEPIVAEPSNKESNEPAETLQSNGTTSKNGQKSDQGTLLLTRSNDNNKETLQFNGTTSKSDQKSDQGTILTRSNDNNKVCNKESVAGDRNDVNDQANFECLVPLTRIPKEGDVIAYRLVELSSSSWCPELSSFRVGKVSSYDSISLKIILVPVPKYPIFPEGKSDEEPNSQVGSSSYKNDGSLEIDYPSLVDVRLLGDGTSGKNTLSTQNETVEKMDSVNNMEVALINEKDTSWEQNNQEQNNQALNEKAELQNNDGWGRWVPNKNPVTPPSSYMALRRTAFGPVIVASLRGGRGNYRGMELSRKSSFCVLNM